MNALETALQGRAMSKAAAPARPLYEGAHRMARALLAWALRCGIRHQVVTDLRAAVDAGGRVIDEIDAFWFEMPDSTGVRPIHGAGHK